MPRLRSTLALAALLAALTAALYAVGLRRSPPHLLHDEIKFAIQAQSIAETGHDINGRFLPVYFREPGFAVGRDPLCIYVTAALLVPLPLSETSIRLASAIVGGIGVGLMFVLGRLLFGQSITPWIVAAILALSPTYYIHSRLALSVLYPVPFTILWLITLVVYRDRREAWQGYALGAVLGLGVYSYLAAAIMMPLYLAATIVLLLLDGDRRGIRLIATTFAIMMLPIVVWQLIEPDRYANILSAYRLYEAAPGAEAGKLQELFSVAGLVERLDVWWDAFNPDRLFFTGESSIQISTRQVGSLLTAVAVPLAVGLWAITRSSTDQLGWLLIFGLVTAPLPAVLMADVEIRRWLVVLPFVAAIGGVGIERLLTRGTRGRLAVAAIGAAMVWQFAVFVGDYFGPYRERASPWFGGNIRAAIEHVLSDAAPPSHVYVSTEIPWVDAYWRFYTRMHGRDALLDRTTYVQVESGEVPAAEPGAVMITAVADPSLPARLSAAGWAEQQVIADLDGSPSLTVSRPAPR